MNNEIKAMGRGTVFSGAKSTEVFQLTALAAALDLYGRHRIRVNRAYTPTAMIRAANQATGHNYHRSQYAFAAAALREKARRLRREVEQEMGARA